MSRNKKLLIESESLLKLGASLGEDGASVLYFGEIDTNMDMNGGGPRSMSAMY